MGMYKMKLNEPRIIIKYLVKSNIYSRKKINGEIIPTLTNKIVDLDVKALSKMENRLCIIAATSEGSASNAEE